MSKIVDWDSHIGRRFRLRDLHVFFAVVELGSLAKAAARFRVSQPAVSQLISDLEHAVGAKLFDRTSRGVTPTAYGQALLGRGRAAFDELKQGIRDIQFLSNPTAGEIKFGCQEALAAILAPVLDSFYERYPDVVLDIHEEEFDRHAARLRDRTLEFVLQRWRGPVRGDDPQFNDLELERLFDDYLVVAAGKQSRWARRRRIDVAELGEAPWILAGPETWNYRLVAKLFADRALPMPPVILRTLSTHLRVNMLASGDYIATFPCSVFQFYAARFGLLQLPVPLPRSPWPVVIVTLKGRTLSPVVRLFLDHLRASMANTKTEH